MEEVGQEIRQIGRKTIMCIILLDIFDMSGIKYWPAVDYSEIDNEIGNSRT
jgi:hypothetical protein